MDIVLEFEEEFADDKLKLLAEKYWKRDGYKNAYSVSELKKEFDIPGNETIPSRIKHYCLAVIKGFESCIGCDDRFTFDIRDNLVSINHKNGIKCTKCGTYNTHPRAENSFALINLGRKKIERNTFQPSVKWNTDSNWPENPSSADQMLRMITAYETDKFRHLTTYQHNFLVAYCRTKSFDLAAQKNGIGKEHRLKIVDFLIKEHLICEITGFVLPALRSLMITEGEDVRAKNVFGHNAIKEQLYDFLCSLKLHVFPYYPISRLFELNQAEKFFNTSWTKSQFMNCQVNFLVTNKTYDPLFVIDYLNRNSLEDKIQTNKQKVRKEFFIQLGLPHHEVVNEDLINLESLKNKLGVTNFK